MKGICSLCLQSKYLQKSHIIPKFIFSWLKNTSPGYLRDGQNPNKRIQDGWKAHLLCFDCEQLLNVWEKPFCENLFVPFHGNQVNDQILIYEDWALKFATSVSWRVLLHYSKTTPQVWDEAQQALANEALNTWRNFLVGNVKHPGEFEQHLLPVDAIEMHTTEGLSPFMNRYLLRTVAADTIYTKKSAMVYTKLCRFLLFGFVQVNEKNRWQGTKINLKRGSIKPRDYSIPPGIFTYLNDKANQVANAHANMSKRQKQKINETILSNPDKAAHSESFRALQYDVMHFGDDAFRVTNPLEDSE